MGLVVAEKRLGVWGGVHLESHRLGEATHPCLVSSVQDCVVKDILVVEDGGKDTVEVKVRVAANTVSA